MACLEQHEIQSLVALSNPYQQLDRLAGRLKGGDVVILACGPSLSDYAPDELERLLAGRCVMAVKQAFDVVPELVDFQILNTWNSQRYDYSRRRPFIIRETAIGDPPVFGEADLELTVARPSALSEQLAIRQNFADYTFDRQIDRPWGPGVLYEIGFYLALHLGAGRIITLGWDVGVRASSIMPHFYDRPNPRKTALLHRSMAIRSLHERNRFRHDAGVLYNKPRIIADEVDACIAASEGWHRYLQEQGIELIVVSSGSLVSPSIRRARLEDLIVPEAVANAVERCQA